MTTTKTIQNIFKYVRRCPSPYNLVLVKNNTMSVTDGETYVTILNSHGNEKGYHNIELLSFNRPVTPEKSQAELFLGDLKESTIVDIFELLETLKHASKDETRIHLNGIAFKDSDMVATTGHTLRRVDLDRTLDGDYIIPRTSLEILKKLIKAFKVKGNLKIEFYENYAAVDHAEFRIVMRLINREYPKYRAVIPSRFEHSFKITKGIEYKRLKAALNRDNKCVLSLKEGKVTLRVSGAIDLDEVIGECDESLDTCIGYNMQYLDLASEGLKEFTVQFNATLTPTMVNKSIVMPLKI